MTDEEKKLTERLNNIYDAKVVGTEISDDTMRIYMFNSHKFRFIC